MRTYVVIEVTHKYPEPDLGARVAQRAHGLAGVDNAELVGTYTDNPVKKAGGPTAGDKADAAFSGIAGLFGMRRRS